MYLYCNACGSEFTEEEGIHEACLAWHDGRQAGDYVCPDCGADDSAIEEIID